MVGFSLLVARLKPHETIRVIDHLHALLDEVYSSDDIFIVERESDGGCAVAGLTSSLLEEKKLAEDNISLADSSYGSDSNLLVFNSRAKKATEDVTTSNCSLKPASYYTSQLARAALHLMSASSKVSIPLNGRKQLQVRIAMHSGHCSAGVVGLQATPGSNRIPQFKILGPTMRRVNNLCRTGLALQIRVSKACKDLLSKEDGYIFERCPDYTSWANHKPIESYWLIGKKDMPVKLPSLDLALPLADYEDTEI